LLAGQPLRAPDGTDNGVRLLDVNSDGYLDVVIGNDELRQTRVWEPQTRKWQVSDFPVSLRNSGARFGVLERGSVVMLCRTEQQSGAWRFNGTRWAA